MEINVPVLLIGFNRPDTIKQVFEKIRDAKPTKLYVAIDGPRVGKEGENDLVKQVQEIVKKVDWQCEAHYSFSDKNKGAEITVSYAISWVFEKEEYAIILEDDIIAPFSFFRFAQEMLIKYKEEEKIGFVTGNNFTPIPSETDYYFTRHGHFWGWATWKRVWKYFDLNINIPKEHTTNDFLKKRTNSKLELRYYKKRIKDFIKKGPGNISWDKVALYLQRQKNFLTITPKVNLTSNIGIYGVHAHGKMETHYLPYDKKYSVNNHPEPVEVHPFYDKYHLRKYILKHRYLHKRFFRKINKIISIKATIK